MTFLAFDDTPHELTVPAGTTLMHAATDHRVPGIDGYCGGMCTCGTCHIYIEAPWAERTGARTAVEEEMLNVAAELRDGSRLARQITLTDALDGLVVSMPDGQPSRRTRPGTTSSARPSARSLRRAICRRWQR